MVLAVRELVGFKPQPEWQDVGKLRDRLLRPIPPTPHRCMAGRREMIQFCLDLRAEFRVAWRLCRFLAPISHDPAYAGRLLLTKVRFNGAFVLAVALAALGARQAFVRDYTRSVARCYSTGFYLYGRPGTAKSHTVRRVLDHEVCELYTYQRGHLTAMGLFELIRSHPDDVIVLDDLTSLLRSEVALEVLLGAQAVISGIGIDAEIADHQRRDAVERKRVERGAKSSAGDHGARMIICR